MSGVAMLRPLTATATPARPRKPTTHHKPVVAGTAIPGITTSSVARYRLAMREPKTQATRCYRRQYQQARGPQTPSGAGPATTRLICVFVIRAGAPDRNGLFGYSLNAWW